MAVSRLLAGPRRRVFDVLAGTAQLLGGVLHQRGDPSAGEALLRQAVARDPGRAALHHNRAAALRPLARDPDAADAYRPALVLAPACPGAPSGLGTALPPRGARPQPATGAFSGWWVWSTRVEASARVPWPGTVSATE